MLLSRNTNLETLQRKNIMTTIGITIGEVQKEEITMGYRRIVCDWDAVQEYISLIEDEIERIKTHIETSALTWGHIPYRVYDAEYHTDTASRIFDAALLTLKADMRSLSYDQWRQYADVLQNIASNRKFKGGLQLGSKNVRFFDKKTVGEPGMGDVAEEIQAYIEAHVHADAIGKSIPIKSVATLALIHAGTKLKNAKKAENNRDESSEEVS